MEQLLAYIHSLMDFSEKSMEALLPALAKKEFKKNEFLLHEGQVCNSLFFIEKGYCRGFFEKDGTEKNTSFFFENEMATNISSFAGGQPSAFSIQACEPVSVVVFDKYKLIDAGRQAPDIEVLGRKCLRLTAARLEEQANLFKLLTPQERYEFLEKNRPDMLQRVSLTHLSSYLGIARETLSRIRKRRFGK